MSLWGWQLGWAQLAVPPLASVVSPASEVSWWSVASPVVGGWLADTVGIGVAAVHASQHPQASCSYGEMTGFPQTAGQQGP